MYMKVDKLTEFVMMDMSKVYNPNRIAKSLNLSKATVNNYLRNNNPTWKEYHDNKDLSEFKNKILKRKEELVMDQAINDMVKKINVLKSTQTINKRIERRGDKWVVTDESGKKILGTHNSKEEAINQLRAVESNKNLGEKILSYIKQSKKEKENMLGLYGPKKSQLGKKILEIVDMSKVGSKKSIYFDSIAKQVNALNTTNVTPCDIFKSLLKNIENKDINHCPIVIKDNFLEGYKLCLLSDKHESFSKSNINKQQNNNKFNFRLDGNFHIIKKSMPTATAEKGDIYLAGYASTPVIDRQREKVDKKAMQEAVENWLSDPENAKLMVQHSNVIVGNPVFKITDNDGTEYKTGFDKNGFFLVGKLRDYTPKSPNIIKDVRQAVLDGTLGSYSIAGEAIDKKFTCDNSGQCYHNINKIQLWEVTICDKGANQQADVKVITPNSAMNA